MGFTYVDDVVHDLSIQQINLDWILRDFADCFEESLLEQESAVPGTHRETRCLLRYTRVLGQLCGSTFVAVIDLFWMISTLRISDNYYPGD